MSGQTPSSPSWSVPLHRPPPGVVYDQSPIPPNGAVMPSSYPYPQGQYEGYEDPSASASANVNGNGNGNGWYPPPGDGYTGYPPGPSSYTPTTRRDTVGSTGRLSFSTQPEAESKTPSGPGTGGKKKRKKSNSETDKEKEKRTKTGRACDACVCPLFVISFSEHPLLGPETVGS